MGFVSTNSTVFGGEPANFDLALQTEERDRATRRAPKQKHTKAPAVPVLAEARVARLRVTLARERPDEAIVAILALAVAG